MRAVIFSDLHLNNWREFSTVDKESGLNSRLIEGVHVVEQIRSYMLENGMEFLIFLGDWYDRGFAISPDILEQTVQQFRLFKEANIKVFCIVGNHDAQNLGGWLNGLKPFKDYVFVFDKPVILENPLNCGSNLVCIPSRRNMKEQYETLKILDALPSDDNRNILLGHFYCKQLLQEDGMKESLFESIDLNELDISKLDYIFLGDYHPAVKTTHEMVPVESIGSIIHMNFGDGKREQGRFLDINFDTGERKYVEVDAPKFVDIPLGGQIPLEEGAEKHFYRIHVENKQSKITLEEMLGERDWKIRWVYSTEAKEVNPENRVSILPSMLPRDVVTRYAQFAIQDEQKRERLMKMVMRYIGDGQTASV